VGPAVASVVALKDGRPVSQGSGVVFTLTELSADNSHVAADAKDFQITLSERGEELSAHVADDPETDLPCCACRRADSTMRRSALLAFLRIGELVVAIGMHSAPDDGDAA